MVFLAASTVHGFVSFHHWGAGRGRVGTGMARHGISRAWKICPLGMVFHESGVLIAVPYRGS